MKKIRCLFVCLLALFSCGKTEKPAVAFYYWKTNFSLSTTEKQVLKDNKVVKIYLRYFDLALDSNSQARPVSPVQFLQKPVGLQIIPVIYIKNEVLLSAKTDNTELARKTTDFISQINTKTGISCNEIQIDCDWTLQSRDKYMDFIAVFKKSCGKKLSATIRMHQIKYSGKTRIPDVNQGVLMYYNMGKIAADAANSIYDRAVAERYLKSLKNYPLPLDIALPVYSWAVHIRNGKVIRLKNKCSIGDLAKDTNFVPEGQRFFRATNSHYQDGVFYRKGDLLKIEGTSNNDLLEMAQDLAQNVKNAPREIIFYDLDDLNLKNYEKSIFEKVAACF